MKLYFIWQSYAYKFPWSPLCYISS